MHSTQAAHRTTDDGRTACSRCGFCTANPDELRKFSALRIPGSDPERISICGRCTDALMATLRVFAKL